MFVKVYASYGSYHHNNVNQIIHIICVPIIVFSLLALLEHLQLPHLSIALTTLQTLYYIKMNFVLGLVSALYVLGGYYMHLVYLGMEDKNIHFKISLTINLVSWILQFIGHGFFQSKFMTRTQACPSRQSRSGLFCASVHFGRSPICNGMEQVVAPKVFGKSINIAVKAKWGEGLMIQMKSSGMELKQSKIFEEQFQLEFTSKINNIEDHELLNSQEENLFLRIYAEHQLSFRLQITSEEQIYRVLTASFDLNSYSEMAQQQKLSISLIEYIRQLKRTLLTAKISKEYEIILEVNQNFRAVLSITRSTPIKSLVLFEIHFQRAKPQLIRQSIKERYSIMQQSKRACLERLQTLQRLLQIKNPQLLVHFKNMYPRTAIKKKQK